MKPFIKHLIVFALFMCATAFITQTEAQAQVLPKVTTYDYMMGSGANTWFAKINAAIDSMNSMIDSLAQHRNKIYVAAGGSIDTTKYVSMDRDDIIKGDKTFNAAINFSTSGGSKILLYPNAGYGMHLGNAETWITTDNSTGTSIGFGGSVSGASLNSRWATMKAGRLGVAKIPEKSAVDVTGGVRADSVLTTTIIRQTEIVDSSGWVSFDSSSTLHRRYRVLKHQLPSGLYMGKRQGTIWLEVEFQNGAYPASARTDIVIRTDSAAGVAMGGGEFKATVTTTNGNYAGNRYMYQLGTTTGGGLMVHNPQGSAGWGTNGAFTFLGVGSIYGTTQIHFYDTNSYDVIRATIEIDYAINHGASSALPVYFTEQ